MAKARMDLNAFVGKLLEEQDGDVLAASAPSLGHLVNGHDDEQPVLLVLHPSSSEPYSMAIDDPRSQPQRSLVRRHLTRHLADRRWRNYRRSFTKAYVQARGEQLVADTSGDRGRTDPEPGGVTLEPMFLVPRRMP